MADKKHPQLPFEDAFAQLESLVEGIETGEIPLAELMNKFEAGTHLLRLCEAHLKNAELRLDLLKKQTGSPFFEPFTPPVDS